MQNITVTALDAYGHTIPGYTGTVHFTSTDSQAMLPADYTFTAADNGTHTFSITLLTAGTQQLVVTAQDVLAGSTTIAVTPTALAGLRVSGFSNLTTLQKAQAMTVTAVAGQIQTFTVTAVDAYGNTITSYLGTVYFKSTDTQAQLPADYTFTAADQGRHTFSAKLLTAGTQTLIVTGTNSNSSTDENKTGTNSGSSTDQSKTGTDSGTGQSKTDTTVNSITGQIGITVSPAQAASLQVSGIPSATTAGQAQSFTVTAYDVYGNVATGYTGTVVFSTSDPSAWAQSQLPAPYTFTAADAGRHVFSADFATTGNQTLTATDSNVNSITGHEGGITVSPAALAGLQLTGLPGTATAGQAQTFTVTALDAYGNLVTGYTGTVNFLSGDAHALLQTTYTFTAADQGTHSFSVTFVTAGSQYLAVNDAASQTGATFADVTVNAGQVAQLQVSGFPAITAGVAQSFTVTAYDAYGNVATGYTDTVYFKSSDSKAVLPANYPFTAADQGTHTFSATLLTAGTQSLIVTDANSNSVASQENGIAVSPAALASLQLTGLVGATTAGQAQGFTVTAGDAYGNAIPGYTGTVHFTSSDAKAVLPANYTFTSADAGKHTFSATLVMAGTQTLTVLAPAGPNVPAGSGNVVVSPAQVAQLAFGGFPGPATAGSGTVAQVAPLPVGGITTVPAGSITTVPVSTAQLALPAVGSLPSPITVGSGSVAVSPTQVVAVSGFPVITAGVAQGFTVTAQDAYGNVVTGYTDTVSFTSSDARAGLPAIYTFTAADQGTHTFSATLLTAGPRILNVTDANSNSVPGLNGGIEVAVSPAAVASLQLTSQPGATTAGQAQSLTVTALDAYGNIATGYTGTVHFNSTDSRAVLPADYLFTAADAGTHTFSSFTLVTAGTQNLTVLATAGPNVQAGSGNVTVNAAQAVRLQVSGFPATTAGVGQSFTVTANDTYGNVVTGYTGTVQISSSDARAGLLANYTFTATDQGAHTFSATLVTAGTQNLIVADANNNSVTGQENGIAVSPAAPASLQLTGLVSATTAGQAQGFTVTANDTYGNVVTGYTGTVHFKTTDSRALLPADYTFTAADAGRHTFSATWLTTNIQNLAVLATAGPNVQGSSSNVTVSPGALAGLQMTGLPGTATAGQAQTFTVTAVDAYGNTITGYRGTATFLSSDGHAVLQAPPTFTAANQGTHTFSRHPCDRRFPVPGRLRRRLPDGRHGPLPHHQHGGGGQPATHQPVRHDHGGTGAGLHSHGAGRLRQRRHRLHEHGPLHQQRRQGGAAGQLHLHGRRCGQTRLQRHARDGRHRVPDRPGHSRSLRPCGEREHYGQRGTGGAAGGQRLPQHDHGGRGAHLHGDGLRHLRQRRHRLRRHRVLQEQRLPGGVTGQLYLHGGQPGHAHLQRHVPDGRHPELDRHRPERQLDRWSGERHRRQPRIGNPRGRGQLRLFPWTAWRKER